MRHPRGIMEILCPPWSGNFAWLTKAQRTIYKTVRGKIGVLKKKKKQFTGKMLKKTEVSKLLYYCELQFRVILISKLNP